VGAVGAEHIAASLVRELHAENVSYLVSPYHLQGGFAAMQLAVVVRVVGAEHVAASLVGELQAAAAAWRNHFGTRKLAAMQVNAEGPDLQIDATCRSQTAAAGCCSVNCWG
jgi:hypothetical protein